MSMRTNHNIGSFASQFVLDATRKIVPIEILSSSQRLLKCLTELSLCKLTRAIRESV